MDLSDPGLTAQQIDIFSILERVCSVFSLLGSMFVITTFSFSKAFHKPINRLVFYATFGNLMTNVATLMARSFINDTNSAGCQFQAFLIQMFMPADAFWMLAMAVNVYLTFYFKFDAQRLRRMEIPYMLCCYGIPFIVAITMVFVSTPEKGRMFGNATLWCWTAPKWDIFRIAIFYGPVWVVILLTFAIYIRAGREIYKKHKQLKEFSFSTSHHEPEPLHGIDDMFSSTKTTEVYVTTEVIDKPGAIDLAPLGGAERRRSQAGQIHPPQKPPKAAYSVTISSNRHNRESNPDHNNPNQPDNYAPKTSTSADRPTQGGTTNNLTRTHTLTHSSTNPKPPPTATGPPPTTTTTTQNPNPLRRRAAFEANNATWSYTKCAILFFTAMLVTWIPSSANRVYSVIHAGQASLALEYMSAFVLPLQGWWNAVIYCVTSWGACKMLWGDLRAYWWGWGWRCCGAGRGRGRRGRGRGMRRSGGGVGDDGEVMDGAGGLHHGNGGGGGGVGLHLHRSAFQMMGRGGNGGEGKTYETESMTELAASRPGSSGSPVSAEVGMEMGRPKREREV